MNTIWRILITLHDKDSVLMSDHRHDDRYFIRESDRKYFKKESWNDRSIELFNECFEEIDEDIFLVKEKVYSVTKIFGFSISDSECENPDDIYDINWNTVLDDLDADKFKEFNEFGKRDVYFNVLIKEHWSQCYEGDWDCNYEYLGILDIDNINIDDLITKKSLENKKERQKEYEEYWSNYYQ